MSFHQLFDASFAVSRWIDQTRLPFLKASQFWYLCLTPLLLAAAILAIRSRTSKARARHFRQYGFLVLVFVVLVMMRLPYFCRDSLDPDEATFISSAMRLTVDPIAYRSVDTGTSGVLNVYILTIPALFGRDLNYVTSRVTGMALMFGTIVAMWLVYRLLVGRRLAALLVMPFFICIAGFSTADFMHFSSEQLSVFLSATILCLLAFESTRDQASSPWPLAAAGALASAMVFSKFQASPVALTLLLATAYLGWRKRNKLSTFLWVAGATAALPAFLLTLFYSVGAWTVFWTSFINRNIGYSGLSPETPLGRVRVGLEVLFVNPDLKWYCGGLFAMAFVVLADQVRMAVWPRSGTSRRWVTGLTVFSGLLMLLSGHLRIAVLIGFAIVSLLLVLALSVIAFSRGGTFRSKPQPVRIDRRIRPSSASMMVFAGILLVIALFVVATPGTGFPHYGFFYLVPLGLCTATVVLWFFEHSSGIRRWRIRSELTACFLTLTCAIPVVARVRADYRTALDTPVFSPQSDPVAIAIRQHATSRDRLVVWGWNSQLYVASGVVSGTRFPDFVARIDRSPWIDHFRKVYLRDFTESMPAVFVDSVGPNGFRYLDRSEMGFETFPELREVIDDRYRLLADIQGNRVFVRRD